MIQFIMNETMKKLGEERSGYGDGDGDGRSAKFEGALFGGQFP